MTDIGREIQASKATAERQFVIGRGHPDKATNIVKERDFNNLLTIDWTPTKKYIHAILRWLILPEMDFITGKNRDIARWNYWILPEEPLEYDVTTNTGSIRLLVRLAKGSHAPQGIINVFEVETLENYLEDYESAQARKIPVRDPNSFQTLNEFVDHLDALDDKYKFRDAAKLKESLSNLYHEYRKVTKHFVHFMDNSDYFVLGLLDFDASSDLIHDYMGEEPHWCVARQRSYWEEYRDDKDCCFYWVVSKKEYRQCWMVQVPGYDSHERFTIWDWDDNPISVTEMNKLLAKLGKDRDDFEILDVWGKRTPRYVAVVYVEDLHLDMSTVEGAELECSDLETNLYENFMKEAETFVEDESERLSDRFGEVLVGTAAGYDYYDLLSNNDVDDDRDTVDKIDPTEDVPGFYDFVDEHWTEIIRHELFKTGDIFLEVSPAWLAARGVNWPKNFSEENYRDYEKALEGWFKTHHAPVQVTIHMVPGLVYVDWAFDSVYTPFKEHSRSLMEDSYLVSLLCLKMLLHRYPEMTIEGMKRKSSRDPHFVDSGVLETNMVEFTNTWLDRYYR